jgi:hypothetical protein
MEIYSLILENKALLKVIYAFKTLQIVFNILKSRQIF